MDAERLERMEQIAEDTKKVFSYNKSTGQWAWCNRGEEDDLDSWHGEHKTRLAALRDAVEPYESEEPE